MSQFDPPPIPPQPPTVPGPLGGVPTGPRPLPPFSFENAFTIGFESFKTQYGMLVAMAAILFGASIASTVLDNIISLINPFVSFAVNMVLQLLVIYPLTAGATFVGVRAARGQKLDISNCGLGFRRWGTVVVTYLLIVLINAALCLPAALGIGVAWMLYQQTQGGVGDPGAEVIICGAVGVVITLILLLWAYARLLLAPWIAIDPQWAAPGPQESIAASWRLTQPHFWSLLGLAIVTGLLLGLSLLLCCIGVFLVGMPIYMSILGAAYAMICAPFFATACPHCGYDLTGAPTGTCPECGGSVSSSGPLPA